MHLERVRWWGAPPIAFVCSALVLCCLVGVGDVTLDWPRLRALSGDFGGWAGLAVVVAVVAAVLGLAGADRVGPAPALAVAAVAAVFGAVLSASISTEAQLVVALLTLAAAVGAGFAAGLAVLAALPARWSRAAAVAFVAPLAAGWAPLAWLGLHAPPTSRLTLGAHLSPWIVGAAGAALLGYAVVCYRVEAGGCQRPGRPAAGSTSGWQDGWAALATLVVAGGSLAMLLGFRAGAASVMRPVVLLTMAASLAGFALCAELLPDDGVRAGYLAVVVALLAGPSCVALLLLASARGAGPVPWWVAAVLAAAGLLGAGLGWCRPAGARPAGLIVMALGCVAAWGMPSSPVALVLAAAPLCAGIAGAATAGLRSAATSAAGLRLVAVAGLVALLAGVLTAFPLTWALGTTLSTRVVDVRAAGRVLLGLTFALALLAAAGTAVLSGRARAGRVI